MVTYCRLSLREVNLLTSTAWVAFLAIMAAVLGGLMVMLPCLPLICLRLRSRSDIRDDAGDFLADAVRCFLCDSFLFLLGCGGDYELHVHA